MNRTMTLGAGLATLLMALAPDAGATDSYSPASRQLVIPALTIGGATYGSVTLTVSGIVSGPSGQVPAGTVDSYDPATGWLTVPAVTVGSTTYYNVVATVGELLTVGSVTGGDTFNGTYLTLASVQAGSTTFSNATLAVTTANLRSVGGKGLPTSVGDEFNAATGLLTLPAVLVGNTLYTNVVLAVDAADLVAVGPAATIAQVQNDVFAAYCSYCHTGYGAYLPGSLNLSGASSSMAALVGQPSVEDGSLLLVKPGDPLNSYLIQKLQGAPSISGARMPYGGPYLTPAQVQEVSSWILGL